MQSATARDHLPRRGAPPCPDTLDTFVLRRISPRLYASISSLGPVGVAVFGVLVLCECLLLQQQLAIVVACLDAGAAIASQREQPASELERTARAIP